MAVPTPVPTPTRAPASKPAAFPVATMANGQVRYSDGSVRGTARAATPVSKPAVLGATTTAPRSTPAPVNNQPQQDSGGGDSGGGIDTSAAEDANRRAIEAAMAAYDAQKQALQNQIPEYQKANELRLTGLDQGLQDFNQTATREEGTRIAGIDDTIGQIGEQYTRANRSTRQSAQSLAKQLRNQFASRGTLDSTQYKDMNIDQSKELLQSVGDIRREQAGKTTTALREKDDIGKYYSEQRTQQARNVELEKNKVRQDTNSFIREIMDKVNITDKQKVEAIESAKASAQQQILELSLKQQEINRQTKKDNEELSLKKQELATKGYSSNYNSAKDSRAAITAADASVQKYEKSLGRALSANEVKQIFTNFGVGDKAPVFGTEDKKDTKAPGKFIISN